MGSDSDPARIAKVAGASKKHPPWIVMGQAGRMFWNGKNQPVRLVNAKVCQELGIGSVAEIVE
jgi:hypothetical protein